MFNTLSFPMANMFACTDMIYGGVMERFPKLKVAYLEGNCSWLPWLLWRMEEYGELTGVAEHPQMKLTPLEYFQRQCWGAVECDEHVAKFIPEFGLEDNIVFSTDYPHLDVKYPHAVESLLKQPFTDQMKRNYCGIIARDCMGLATNPNLVQGSRVQKFKAGFRLNP